MSKWISVKDKLPEKDMFLSFVVDGKVMCGFYDYEGEFWMFADDWVCSGEMGGRAFFIDEVTHWMPAPNFEESNNE